MTYTAEEKAKEAEREVAMRERVYSRWVADKRMSQADADRKLAIMREVAEDYRRDAVAQKEAKEFAEYVIEKGKLL